MSNKPIVFKLDGFGGFVGVLGSVEDVPKKCVSRAAGKGATVVRRAIRGTVPVGETGNLKRGIYRKGERSRLAGKKVYQLAFNPAMNDVFQKPIKNPGEAGGKSKHAYYPASMEYGFLTRSKGGGYSYVPGYHFMRDAAEDSSVEAKSAMIKTLNEQIDKEWSKK